MKTLATLFAAILSLSLYAQTDTTVVPAPPAPPTAPAPVEADTIEFGGKKVIILNEDVEITEAPDFPEIPDMEMEDSHFDSWEGIDLGVNVLLNKDNKTDLGEEYKWLELDYAQSFSWRFNFSKKINIVKEYAGLVTGLGLTYNSYGLKNDVDIISNTTAFPDTTFGVFIPDTVRNYSKNKIRATYLQIPLMLEFNTSAKQSRAFHIAGGVIGGYKIGSITKQKYEQDNSSVKVRVRDDFNFTPFTLDATARIGYGKFTLWATYGLTPLFEKDKGPEVYPFSVGLSIIPG